MFRSFPGCRPPASTSGQIGLHPMGDLLQRALRLRQITAKQRTARPAASCQTSCSTNLRHGDIEFPMQARQQGFQPAAFFLQRSATGKLQLQGQDAEDHKSYYSIILSPWTVPRHGFLCSVFSSLLQRWRFRLVWIIRDTIQRTVVPVQSMTGELEHQRFQLSQPHPNHSAQSAYGDSRCAFVGAPGDYPVYGRESDHRRDKPGRLRQTLWRQIDFCRPWKGYCRCRPGATCHPEISGKGWGAERSVCRKPKCLSLRWTMRNPMFTIVTPACLTKGDIQLEAAARYARQKKKSKKRRSKTAF